MPIFETALSDLPEAKHARLRGGILADLAFSKLELGDSLPATELLSRIDGEIEAALETDDRVVYLAQLVRFADVLSTASSTSLRARLQLAITAHSAVTVELSTQIKDLDFFASDQPQIDGAVR